MDCIKAILDAPISTLLIVSGIVFFLLSFIQKLGNQTVFSQQPKIWALVIGTALLLFGIGLLYITPFHKPQDFPFESTTYDFENISDETDIDPFFTVPSSKSYKAVVSRDFSHSGKHSMRIFVDMQSADINPETEYTGIGVSKIVPLQAKAIIVWVYIPSSESNQNTIFKGHFLAYNNNETGENMLFMGEEIEIKPDVWTPFFIGTFAETSKMPNPIQWYGKIDELYLTIWSDKRYIGSMYIDDFSIYK